MRTPMKAKEIAHALLEEVATVYADRDQARAKHEELLRQVKELRASLTNRERTISNKDTKIAQLREQVAYHKTHTLRYQADLAEARSLLRKVRH
jgi:chromosome segregation ATPase